MKATKKITAATTTQELVDIKNFLMNITRSSEVPAPSRIEAAKAILVHSKPGCAFWNPDAELGSDAVSPEETSEIQAPLRGLRIAT